MSGQGTTAADTEPKAPARAPAPHLRGGARAPGAVADTGLPQFKTPHFEAVGASGPGGRHARAAPNTRRVALHQANRLVFDSGHQTVTSQIGSQIIGGSDPAPRTPPDPQDEHYLPTERKPLPVLCVRPGFLANPCQLAKAILLLANGTSDLTGVLGAYLSLVRLTYPQFDDRYPKIMADRGFELVYILITGEEGDLFRVFCSIDEGASKVLRKFNGRAMEEGAEASPEVILLTEDMANLAADSVNPNLLDMSSLQVMWAIFNLVTVKLLTSNNREPWLLARMRAMTPTAGHYGTPGGMKVAMFPDVDKLASLYVFCASHYQMRREGLSMLRKLAKSPTAWGPLSSACLSLMKGAEMNQVVLIIQYICMRHSFILGWPRISHEVNNFIEALRVLKGVAPSPEDFLYAKLLYPTQDLAILKRDNFRVLVGMARALAMEEMPSMSNYASAVNEAPEIKGLIEEGISIIKDTELYLDNGFAPEDQYLFDRLEANEDLAIHATNLDEGL